MNKIKTRVILSPGHGGMAFGQYYMTKGKQSPDGNFLEGVYNRRIAGILCENEEGPLEYENLAPGPVNIPLWTRVKATNEIVSKNKSDANTTPLFISLHCNAKGTGKRWYQANGFVIFYPRVGYFKNESRALAEIIKSNMLASDIQIAPRSKCIKPANFRELVFSKCPSVLFEMGFMTNRSDVLQLKKRQKEITTVIAQSCEDFFGR